MSKLKRFDVPPTSNDPLKLFSCCNDLRKLINLQLEPEWAGGGYSFEILVGVCHILFQS